MLDEAGSGYSAQFKDSKAAAQAAIENSGMLDMGPQTQAAILLAIHFIGCIWGLYMVEGSVYTTLARSAAVWFFSHGVDEQTGKVVQKGTFFFGLRVVIVCAWCIISR